MRDASLLVVTDDETLVEEINSNLSNDDIRIADTHHVEEMLKEQYSFILLDEWMIESINTQSIPTTSVLIVLMRDRSFENARKWMAMGASELIIIPDELDNLEAVLQKKDRMKRQDINHFNDEYVGLDGAGAVRVFYSAKGGTGKTLIASMVAQNLQIQYGQRVILIDFNVQFGGVEVLFGLDPERSYLDLLPVINELSINHIQNVTVKEENTGIHVLLSPADPEQIELISEELVTRIIRTCRNHFDQVIVDLPAAFNTATFIALHEATHIYYVMNPDSLSVRTLKHSVELFRRYQIGNRDNVSLIINRHNSKSELSEQNIAQFIDLPVSGIIRSDFYGLQPNLNMGKPFYLKKNDKGISKTAQDVKKMVRKSIVKGG
ncbi:AAA family ATPase [Lederbergia galactosidilytica]|uniref:AAA domain-containing protein n=1 Tax=Lederbergia galactosidilytica TaxID=217031 RepID=A0A0Q9XZ05_9BACI|nr:AAA family ATPase [Lederbergia galactosidilytica]KRG09377.1 hypothetical protein ACA29_23240 [Lederbergia galactosidilytica]KRG13175.1 hypothetical protein ACA30_16380 [Virgibacillus soli]MBP1917299.1 pilus assembly protein CpaE [Lederbergia galactosidilytica]OAK69000.1 hypothetical protein ABB05_14535 [Lederbergia galactosidilytica]